MTRNKNNARRAAARRLVAEQGVSYTQARREAAPQEEHQDIPPAPHARELRLDLDHQGNSTVIMGYAEGRTLRGGVGKTTSVVDLSRFPQLLAIDGFDRAATDTTTVRDSHAFSRETLVKLLENLSLEYDHVFIDVPPGSDDDHDDHDDIDFEKYAEGLLATWDKPRAHELVPAPATVPAHTGDWTCTCGAWSAPDAWRNDIVRQEFERHTQA